MARVRQTKTFAILEVSRDSYVEIHGKLTTHDYNHCVQSDGTVLMDGIGIKPEDKVIMDHDDEGPLYFADLDADALRDGKIVRAKK